MKNFLLILLLSFTFASGQIKKTLNESVSGTYTTVQDGEQLVLNINLQNHFEYRNYYFDINPMYNVTYNAKDLTSSEFLAKQDLGLHHKEYSLFVISQYDSSLIRSITYDEWLGIGGGKKIIHTSKVITSLSYCIVQQIRKYSYQDRQEIYRNSIRLKSSISYESVSVQLEYYYQPAFKGNDVYVLGTAMIVILPNNPINFIIQNSCTYMSKDPVNTIQNTTFGIKINLK